MNEVQPSGTVTLVFTDVEGSTKLLEELGTDAYREALGEHRRVVREAFGAQGGYEVDYEGDAFFYAFASAQSAVSAVCKAMVGLEAGAIRIRVGVHTGVPELDPPKYVGMDVHQAARIMSVAHGGQVVLSPSTVSLLEPGTFELIDLGEHRLKDIEEALSIFQLGDASFPPLKTISNTNLPRPASSFVGREPELSEVLTRIEGGARLVTLTGPGGTGKTRLALEAASSLVSAYKAGVFWVGLASLRDPALVTETIAQTLGAKDGLAEHIAERELLLLLDNLEQVIEAAPELSALLSVCSNLTLLVTSRELLRVSGEVEYPVPPLAEPEAVSLFCERAQLDPSEEIAELCARLDNLPLAVELAAARVKALSPAQILERLSQRLDVLKGGRDADPRQQTLRATLEWSYDLLSDHEQRLFAPLSVFAGGSTLEAAEEVCDADLDTLQSLVEKSLLRFTNERYWMLETIREYASERIEQSGEAESLRRRHADFMRQRLTDQGRADRLTWVRLLEPERDNLRAAMRWALDVQHVEASLLLATAYGWLCAFRGPLGEGRIWLAAALRGGARQTSEARANALYAASSLEFRQGNLESARLFGEETLSLARDIGDPELIGKGLRSLGLVAGQDEQYERSESLQREALAVFRESGNEREVRESLGMLGYSAMAQGDYRQARSLIKEALTLSREANDSRGVSVGVANLGWLSAQEGRFEEALPLMGESVVLAHEQLDVNGIADQLEDIAAVAAALQRFEHAAVLLGGAERLYDVTESGFLANERTQHEHTATTLREQLGPDRLAQLWRRGRGMTIDQIVAYTLEFIDSQS